MKLTESKLRLVIKEELKKLLREWDTDWLYDYQCDELEDLLANIDQREFESDMEKQFTIRSIKDRIESCNSPSEDW
jgi:hypothetical protein